jgi:photosystem II stability/assembly factor-like uncharacterized protein
MKLYYLSFLLLFSFLSCNRAPKLPPTAQLADSLQNHYRGMATIVFRSADGGQSWQDISEGLPQNLQEDSKQGNRFFANDQGLFVRIGKERYHNATNATPAFWTKENVTGQDSSNASGILYWGIQLKTRNGTSVWSPIFENYQEPRMRTVFESAAGAIFVGTDRGFFRSTDKGKTWKQVHAGSLVGHMAESDGVLVAISNSRIIRSADNGENWEFVTVESDTAFDVKQVKGGFAALTPTKANIRGVSTSYDGGKTWQPGDAGRKDKAVIDSIFRTWNDRPRLKAFQTSITRVGENFFCTHPEGIFKTSNKGTTWELLLPAIKDKAFTLFVSGNVIYAIAGKGGC